MTWTGGCLCGDIRYEAEVTETEDWVSVQSGSLDDPELAPPQGHYGIESWISWLKIEDDLKRQVTQENEYG